MGEPTDVVMPLLRGTIHECDRMLRNWAGDEPVPAKFYLTYGSALFELGTILNDKDLDSYMEAAKERLETGLERCNEANDDENTKGLLRVGLARYALGDVSIESKKQYGEECRS